jgi:hypothetical protein
MNVRDVETVLWRAELDPGERLSTRSGRPSGTCTAGRRCSAVETPRVPAL